MFESISSLLKNKWPWDCKKENLTGEVLLKIVKNLPSYVKDLACRWPTESDYHYWFEVLMYYCKVSKEHFDKLAREASDFLKQQELMEVAKRAFELVDMLLEFVQRKRNDYFDEEKYHWVVRLPNDFYTLESKWDSLIKTCNLQTNSKPDKISKKHGKGKLNEKVKNLLELHRGWTAGQVAEKIGNTSSASVRQTDAWEKRKRRKNAKKK